MRLRLEKIHAKPLKLVIENTNTCMLRCPFCPTGTHQHDRSPGRARRELITNLLAEAGEYLFFIEFFNWGEPLLHKEVLFDWVRQASEKKIVTSVSTNLNMRLSDADIEALIESGLNKLNVSLDGATRETYATYRQNGDFSLALDNVKRIIDMRRKKNMTRPWVVWQFLVFGFNEHERAAASAMAAEIGVDEISFIPPFVDMAAQDGVAWMPKDPAFVKNRYRPGKQRTAPRCDWHYLSATINWDGGVAPCCALYKTKDDFGTIGEFGEQSFGTVVNNEKYTAVRRFFACGGTGGTGLVCEQCPLPEIMTMGKALNRSIFSLVIFQMLGLLLRPFLNKVKP
jgi:MoaA/NifB/PqqE/SkfB family radical SAM enzyme